VAPLPERRWFHRAGLGSDGRIYAFGGYVEPKGSRVPRNGLGRYAMVVYDPEKNAWSRAPAPPPFHFTLRDVNLHRVKGKWIRVPWQTTAEKKVRNEVPNGGSGGTGEIYWFVLPGPGPVVFDPAKGAWGQPEGLIWDQGEQRYEGSTPAFLRWHAAIATGPDGRIYFVGGFGRPKSETDPRKDTLLLRAEAYDPKTDTWSVLAPMHRGRQLFAACFGPVGRLYVFGGFGHIGTITQWPDESNESFRRRGEEMDALDRALDSVEMWDPKTNTWSPRAPMPLAVQSAGAALGADGRIYVVGGTPRFSNPKPVARVQVYDPRTNTWSRGPSLRTRRQGHAVVATPEGRIYAIGGTNAYSVFHPRQIVGGAAGTKGDVLDSVEVLETKPRKSWW